MGQGSSSAPPAEDEPPKRKRERATRRAVSTAVTVPAAPCLSNAECAALAELHALVAKDLATARGATMAEKFGGEGVMLLRFLRARPHDIAAAAAMWRRTLAWRAAQRVDHVLDDASARRVWRKVRPDWPAEYGGTGPWIMKAPAIVSGATRQMTGVVPSTMGASRWPRMPMSTEVGQSGPPTSVATLPRVMPGWLIMTLIARISLELMPTAARTLTYRLRLEPKPTCCIAHAQSLMQNPTSMA